jgi:hypothetical protein
VLIVDILLSLRREIDEGNNEKYGINDFDLDVCEHPSGGVSSATTRVSVFLLVSFVWQ